ncbi:MAG TPA: hypothetical protein PKW95_06325 [bacterium]|nr:hypothetical protein [bacterium]
MSEAIHYQDRILEHRLLAAGYGVDHNNEIIRAAATHLGRNFPTDYGADWPYEEDAGLFIHRPLAWCSEFASWAIREGTKDSIHSNVKVKTVKEMFDYYKGLSGQRCYTSKNTEYSELGEKIQPGFYCGYYHRNLDNSLGPNHSMIFIRWTDGFDPNKATNKMTTISGVSGGVKVIEDYKVGTMYLPNNYRDKYIYWNADYDYADYNGFINTWEPRIHY